MRVISGEARGHTLKAPKGMTTRPMADKIKGAVFSMLSNLLDPLGRDWGRVLDLYAGSGSIGIEALSRGAEWADFVEVNAGVCRVISENLEHTKLAGRARVNNRTVQSFLNSPPALPGSNHAQRAPGGLHRRKGGRARQASPIPAQLLSSDLPPEGSTPDTADGLAAAPGPAIQPDNRYDIIFLDPPYADPKIPETLAHVARSGLVRPGGLVVIGHSPRVALPEVFGQVTTGPGSQLNLLRHRRHGDSAFTIFLAGDPAGFGFLPAQASEPGDGPAEDRE